jgi:hypothetical protein
MSGKNIINFAVVSRLCLGVYVIECKTEIEKKNKKRRKALRIIAHIMIILYERKNIELNVIFSIRTTGVTNKSIV